MTEKNVARSLVTVAELASRLMAFGERVLVLLIGVPGSGKSTLALNLLKQAPFVRINADSIRKELTGDESNHSQEGRVWKLVDSRFDAALAEGKNVLVDNMNHTRSARKRFVKGAREAGYAVVLLYLDVPLEVLLQRNVGRGKNIPDSVIETKYEQLKLHGQPIAGEDFLRIAPGPTVDEYFLSDEKPVATGRRYDVIGDVHGCYDELVELLERLGYKIDFETGDLTRPKDRWPAFVGDLTDRGPKSAAVLDLVMKLSKQGCPVVLGNHCWNLVRYLQGKRKKLDSDLQRTLNEVRAHRDGFELEVQRFLEEMPFTFETEDLIMVHAAYREDAFGGKARSLALYGETTGEMDASGYPVRLDTWETEYAGGKTIVHGHVVVSEPTVRNVSNGGRIVNVDTGACFGGKLTALRFPEMEFVSVAARTTS
jgi:protein phosphatase